MFPRISSFLPGGASADAMIVCMLPMNAHVAPKDA